MKLPPMLALVLLAAVTPYVAPLGDALAQEPLRQSFAVEYVNDGLADPSTVTVMGVGHFTSLEQDGLDVVLEMAPCPTT